MPAPYALFCADPINPRSFDPAFEIEVDAARGAGFIPLRLDHDELDHRMDADAALRHARFDGDGKAIYRGWMLSSGAYERLFAALARRGIALVTTPKGYAACHTTPGSYGLLRDWMPETAWVPKAAIDDVGAVQDVLSNFGPSPIIVKDWVKSQAAGYWAEACFIPDASDTEIASRVISRFRALQGESLEGGLVFKRYISLLPTGGPAFEYRAFVVDGRVVGCWPRSEQASEIGTPPASILNAVASSIPSPFASADFGRDLDERWWLLEVGDGQVSGLPDEKAADAVFAALLPLAS